MADNDNRYRLWQTISKEYDLPDYNQFSKDMEDATKRKSLHDAVSAEYDLPDFDQFSKDMGYGQQTTQQGNQNTQNVKKPQQTTQSSQVEEGRGVLGDNGYNKQKIAHEKEASQAWSNLAHKGGIRWTIEGHPEVKMVAVTDDLVKRFPQLEQSRGYQVPFNMSTGTPIMQNIDDKGNIITPDEASEQYTKILTNQDFDYVPKQETAAVQIGSVVNTALSTKGGWLDRMARKNMAQYGDDWEHQKFESDGKEVSASEVFGKVKQTIYDYYNSVLKEIRSNLMFHSDEEKQAYVDNLYKTGQLKEEDIPKANVLHYVQNVDKEEQSEAVRQRILDAELSKELLKEKYSQLPKREKGESDTDYQDRVLHELALSDIDLRKLDTQINQYKAVWDELQGKNTSWKEWGHAFKTSGVGSFHAWDLGATELKDAIELNEVANDMKRGKQMTSSDYMALRVMSQANEADAIENAVMPVSYKSKKGSFISAPFTFGFFVGGKASEGVTSAVNKVVGKVISKTVKGAVLKAGGKKALSAATNLAEKAANTKCVKLFGMLAKDFEKAAFMENTTGVATTGAEILNRHIGTVSETDDGFKMEGESLPTAIIKGEISQNIESQTEFLGEHFPSSLKFIRGMAHTKVGSAMGLRNLAAWLTKVSRTEFATTLKSYATKAGINGVLGEYLEEVAGTAENALLVGDQKFSDLLDVKQQEEVAGSVALSCLGMGIFGTAIYTGQRGLNMPGYYRLQHLQNKWDNAGLDLFTGEEWAKWKGRIDNTPNEGMKSVMADILRADNMTEEQARAAFNYARCSLTLRGMNLGAMKAAQLGLTDDRHIEQDNAYVEGRQAKDEDKHDIQIEFEDRSHELAEKLGISEQQLDNMSDEELESLTGKDDQLDNLIYDYQTSHAKYQGVVDNADDEIDKAAQEAARQTDMATDKSRGTVRNATIKAAKGEEDYGVYIVSGNVATNEDGIINVSESDDMILYYDPKSGKIEHCDAMRLASLGEEVNAEETRNQAIADAKEKAIRKQAGIIDGTVGEGTSFTITDAEGNEHTYEVLADNGDGSAMITMDGNVQDTPVSLQDLQNLKDAEEAKRLEAAKMQRQQFEEEREKQNAPVEDNLDYADIINTNGNVEIAEVVDEEGNAMFPNAEEVFFVQNQGNRAKVMVLDSEGNLQPKLVKKSSVRTLGTMSVDEYRQGRQQALKEAENASEPSLVDETETSNNVVPTGNITTDNTTTNETQPGNEAEVTTSDETQNISNEQENTPKITLEDGTEVPMLEDGNPDFSQLTAGQVAELYDSQFGEDAGQIITNNVNRSKKALDKANAMTVSGGSFVEQKASKEAKDKAIAEAKEKYDSAKAIEDAYNERMLAKEEDTPEGRQNLIEKARRKFNRMKGSVKDNAQAIAQLYDETVGALLHRLYDSTGIDVFDDTANTVDEYVASSIAPYSLNYEGTETSKGVKQETGLSRSDFAKTGLLAKEGKGKTIGQLANDLWRDRPANLENITDQDVRNAIIDLITSGQTAFGLKNHIQNLRIAEAENVLEQQKRQADELAHTEKQKEEEQASTEQANDNTEDSSNTEATLADAQEEDKLADMPFEAPSPDEDAPFSAKDKEKDPLEVWNNMTDEEKAAYIEKNRVKDTRLVDDVVGKKLRKAIEKIAGMMGATIQWQRTDMIRNGWFNPNTKTIYLALDSSILEGVQFVFGHEMTHDIKTKSPAMYDELKGLVKEKYGEELFEAKTNDNEKRYAGVGKTDNDRSYYEEETVADAIGKMINDLNLTHSIALKMSHPLLAKMHDVLLKVKNALMATPYTEDVKGIIRTIEQVYVKTANGTFESSASEGTNDDENVSYSLRQKPEPEKKGTGYKVFVLGKDGKLYPPMVANPNGAATPVGVWLDADAAPVAGESKTGRPQVKQGGKGTQGGSGKLAYRPGWHLGVIPYAIQFNRKDAEGNKTLFPKNFVFAEVEYAADKDYQDEAHAEGINSNGKYQHSLAGLKHLPTDGYYMYRTNPNPETDPWVITGAMKVNRLLTRAEQADIVKKAGREPQKIQEGDVVTDDVVNSINQEIAAAPKFSVKSNVDNQGNPLNQDGTLKLDKIKSVDDLTDEDFTNATRNVQLPTVPQNVDAAIGANGKPVIIKKNIFEKNWNAHKFTPAESRKVLSEALYNTDLVGRSQPTKKPNHWVAIKLDEKSPITVLEVNDNKDNVEVVGWYTLDERNLGRIKRQAERNGGELIMLSPNDKVESLSTPSFNSAANVDNSSETSKQNGGKFSLRLQNAISETDTEPTEAQKKSGNYKKGHVKFGGYDYTIENPKGSYRSGVDENGKEWKQKMNDTYGYIRGKFGKDGDHLDMFINDKADLDSWNGDVFVVDQVNQDGTFDEHKVMYGYGSLDEAKKAYLSNYEKGWTGLGNITPVSKVGFDKWLDKSNRKLKPFADYADITSKTNMDTAPSSFEEFLEHPAVRYSIRNEKERAAAEDAYNFAQENRPDRYSRYAIVNMEKPGAVPQYLEKKAVADNWRRYYNKLKWGNYKLFDLDKPFEDNVKNLVGKFPETFRQGNDERFSLIGKKGAEALDHAEEVSTRLDNLNVARQMEEAKKDAKAIKMTTGWERGADGKWRYEIPDFRFNYDKWQDSNSTILKKMDAKDRRALDRYRSEFYDDLSPIKKRNFKSLMDKYGYKVEENLTLGDVLDGKGMDALFKAYPELKAVRFRFETMPADTKGGYNADTNIISINRSLQFQPDNVRSTIAHEVQHAIQHIEGFARGGNPEYLQWRIEAAKKEWRARVWADALRDKAEEMGEHHNQVEVEKALMDEYKEMGMDNDEWMPDKETRIKGFNYFARGYADRSFDNDIRAFRLNESTRSDYNSYVEYTKLGGEVEARNVQSRMNMSPEERRKILAEETEDVARKDQIFLYWDNDAYSLKQNKDAEYLEAVRNGDMEKAQKMVYDAARAAGYVNGTDYQGEGSWNAPSASVEKKDFANLDALRESVEEYSGDTNVFGIINGVTTNDDDFYYNPGRVGFRDAAASETSSVLRRLRYDKADANTKVKVYRTVPADVKGNKLMSGDWIALSKQYCIEHGNGRYGEGGYRIIEEEVPIKTIWNDGNDMREFGFDDGNNNEAEKNVPNNRKLLDAVTYDNNGNVIPLSERFNESNDDIRYSLKNKDRKQAQLDIILKTNPMLDDYHTGIRKVEDIKTLGESVEEARSEAEKYGDDEWSAYPDITNDMLQNALETGEITIYSSKPIKNGVFVTPSYMQASDYAGGGNVYEKTVPLTDVAWINTDEGQYAKVDGERYSLKEVNDKFNDRLAQLIENPNQKDRVLHLGRSSQFLIDGGIADAEIELDFDKFVRKSSEKYKNNHPFSAGDIKDLPKAIAHPVAVFNSTTKKDHVVMTELNHDGKNFIVAIRATEQNRKNKVVLEVNQITSLYPKGERGIIYWINNNKLSNVDKEKALHFIEALQPHAGTLTSEELSSAANIVRNFVNPKQNDGNLQKTERYSLRVDRYRDELNQWKKDNNLPKDAERPQLPVREPNESAADFLKRVKEYRKQAALWATAPTYEDHLLVSDTAQGQFNLEMQRKAVLTRIVIQDSMLAIRKAQEAIMKEKGVDKLNPAEDAYTAENRSHGKAKNEFEEYNDEFLQPLRKAYNELMQRLGKSYDNVKVYMIAKHGLERNAYIAFKYALDEDYETNEERMDAYKNYKADMDRLNNDADFEAGRIDFAAWKQRDGFIRTKYAPSYFKFRFDENGMTKDYSGLSALFDADDYEGAAADLVKEVEDANPYYTDELWYATNDATKKILRDSYNAGMMTEDNFNFVSGMYRNYIPLRGWGDTNADQVWNYVGGGKGAFNQVVKEAKGRKSLADDPIAYIENMAESAILMNNRNWVKQHLLLLAQNHRTSLLNVSKAWYIKTKDAQGNEEWIPASPQITEGMTGKQVEAALEAFEQKMEQMKQNGEATQKREHLEISYPQTNGEEREHEVRVMKGGEEYVIYVNGDPQLAQAVNNTRARKVREGIEESRPQRILARTGRYMAAAYTSMSPLFIPSNYMRDLTMTLASTAIREDARYNYLLRRNMLRHWNTFPMVLSYQNGTLREKVRNGSASRVEQMFYDFMMNGGETGFVTSVDVEDLKKKFRSDLKDLNRMAANPKKVGHIIMNSIETLNRAIEDSNRFMVYMTSIEYGRSIEEAVNNAKDVTLNFNRKGTGEHGWQAVRDMYLFINPAVQSLQTLGALAKHHPFKFTAVTTGWLATGLLVPMLNNLLMSFFGGDDDKDKYWQFTKWDRRNNFIMWIPFTKEFVKIPLAQEFRGFYGVGDMIASKLWGGEKAEESWGDYAWDLAGQIVDMLPLDPTGYDGNIGLAITPNAARPIGELALNVDFTGKPIFKNSEYNKYDPNFTKAYVGTPDWLVRISKMVNSIDNKYPDVQQNAIDRFGDPKFNPNNPAVIDHLLSSYLGGSYTMGSQIIGVATKALNGDDIKMADIPLASKFVSNPDDRPVSKKQGEEFWDMKERHDRAANTLSKLKQKAKVDGDYSTLDIFFGSDEYRQYKEDDKKFKKYEEDRKKEKAQETGEAYRPHKTTADDVYKSHTTPKDDFEDMKMKQLYEKLNSYKIRYEAIDGISSEKGDAYYKANKAAIDAIEEIAYDKSQIASIKKGFLSDGQNTYDADGMKDIRELRKRILDVLEKANKVMLNNRK